MQYKKNSTYVAGESNFEYSFEILDRSEICSSYVSGQLKKVVSRKLSTLEIPYNEIPCNEASLLRPRHASQ